MHIQQKYGPFCTFPRFRHSTHLQASKCVKKDEKTHIWRENRSKKSKKGSKKDQKTHIQGKIGDFSHFPSQHANIGTKRQKNGQKRIYGEKLGQKRAKNDQYFGEKRIYRGKQVDFTHFPQSGTKTQKKVRKMKKNAYMGKIMSKKMQKTAKK